MAEDVGWTQKYRPTKLEDYVGNEYTKSKVRALTEQGRLPQTILLQGERGTGKTTMARLIAKSLMCLEPTGGQSCGNCERCIQLDENFIKTGIAPRNMSIHSYNMTDMNTREDATGIVAKMGRRTFGNEKQVFILDEVQRASPEAQSSYLQITEEPPEGLYVILCTTNPEKLLVPLRSRFRKFDVFRPSNKDIVKRLEVICLREGVNYTVDGLRLLASKENNVPRECILQAETLGILGTIDRRAVEKELHLISRGIFIDFLDACHVGNLSGVVTMLGRIQHEDTISVLSFVEGMGNYMADLLNAKVGVKLESYSTEDIKSLRKYVKKFDDKQMIALLGILKDYSKIEKSMDFQLLSLAVTIMEELRIEEVVPEITEDRAGRSFRAVSEQVQAATQPVGLRAATESDVQTIFGGARRIPLVEGGS